MNRQWILIDQVLVRKQVQMIDNKLMYEQVDKGKARFVNARDSVG
jgi:hypothetical protein